MHIAPETISGPNDLKIYHVGPKHSAGPLPSLFYFALSGMDSLTLDPFNQPIQFLHPFHSKIRCFSFTLPGHGEGMKNTDALAYWAKEFREDRDPISSFLIHAQENIHYLIEQGWVDRTKMASAGLSRGGLIAALLSLMSKDMHIVIGYAPVTDLSFCQEFQSVDLSYISEKYDLKHLAKDLASKKLRFYIGNRDLLVSTDACYQLIRKVTELAYEQGHKSPPVELIISASIGLKGHGTPPHIFREGIEWLTHTWNIA